MHYLIHLPSQMERYGPLIHSWTMRHEAKLSFIKRASRRGNFKNICFTVVKHHQLWLCYNSTCVPHLIYPPLEHSPKKTESLLRDERDHIQTQIAVINNFSADCTLTRPDWVKYHNSVYRHGSYVLMERHEITPVFGKVLDIVVILKTNDIFFTVELYSSNFFSCHYNAFVINSMCTTSFVHIKSLEDYHILMPRRSFDTTDVNTYISLPYIY